MLARPTAIESGGAVTAGEARDIIDRLEQRVLEHFVGPRSVVHSLVMGMCGGLNVLLEDIPGVGKTTLARSLAGAAGLDFGRIQCTPDLLPGDVTGMTIFDQASGRFTFRSGAIMHEFVLADELNRAATRTQAALLEAMQERAVTVDDRTYPLPKPFFLVATENPMRFAGTFSLPEAQLDRFGMSLSIGYPDADSERRIIDVAGMPTEPVGEVAGDAGARGGAGAPTGGGLGAETILQLRAAVEAVHVAGSVKDYAISISAATRRDANIKLGVSPRGTYHLICAARAEALAAGRDYTVPEDVRAAVPDVLSHRLVLSADARIEQRTSGEVLERIVSRVPMPRGV